MSNEKVTPQSVDELRHAVMSLADRVTGLSSALSTVNELQRRQQESEAAQQRLEQDATLAKKTAIGLEKVVVPREEHEARWKEEQDRLIALRLKIRRQTAIVGSLFFLVSMLALGIAISTVHHNQNVASTARVTECRTRVKNAQIAVASYDNVLKSPTIEADTNLRNFILLARDAAVRAGRIHCA